MSNGWGHESRKKAALKFSLDYEEVNALHNFIFNVYEIGSITLDQYLETVIFNHPRDFSPKEFKDFMYSCSHELPDMLSWLKLWKKDCGFHIVSINNEGKELNDYRVATFGLHDCFDAFISSCAVGIRKPDPRIFELALGVSMVPPGACIYFDDRPMFAHAAIRLGIRAYQHTDFNTTRTILEQIKQENLK